MINLGIYMRAYMHVAQNHSPRVHQGLLLFLHLPLYSIDRGSWTFDKKTRLCALQRDYYVQRESVLRSLVYVVAAGCDPAACILLLAAVHTKSAVCSNNDAQYGTT